MRASLTGLGGLLLIIAVVSIGGCGLKGELYLPENEAATPPSETTEDVKEVEEDADDERLGPASTT